MQYFLTKPKDLVGFTKPGWYFTLNNEIVGPYSLSEAQEIQKIIKETELTPTECGV